MNKLEKDTEKEIMDYLSMIGAKVFKTHDARHRPYHVGIPDLVGCYKGLFFAIEVKKSKSEKAKPDQLREIQHVLDAGGHSLVAYTVEQVQEFMAAYFGVQNRPKNYLRR